MHGDSLILPPTPPAALLDDPGAGAPRLRATLRRAERRARTARLWRVALSGAAMCGGALLLAIGLDAVGGFASWLLVLLDVVLIAVAGWSLYRLARAWLTPAPDARHAAVLLEHKSRLDDSRLINALDFTASAEALPPMLADALVNRNPTLHQASGHGSSAALRRMAVASGEASAAGLPVNALVPTRALAWALSLAVVVVGVWVAAWQTMPRVIGAVAPRLLAPWADLPPWTPLEFAVTVAPSPVYVGKPGAVEVAIHRADGGAALPSGAEFVWRDPLGALQRVAMGYAPHGSDASSETPAEVKFTHRLERLDAALAFRIETAEGRSKWFTLAPDTSPLFESLYVEITPPDYTGFAATERPLNPATLAGDPAPLRLWRGGALTLSVKSNVPLRSMEMDINDATGTAARSFDPDGDDATRVRGIHVVDGDGSVSLRLTGRDGKASPMPLELNLAIIEDQPPRVNVASPQPLAVAPVDWPVPVDVLARDDVRVRALVMDLTLDGKALAPVDLSGGGSGGGGAQRTTHTLDPAKLGVKPDQIVRFAVTAFDNRPAAHGGPSDGLGQRTTTAVYELLFISREAWDALARQNYQLEALAREWEAFSAELDRLAEQRQAINDPLDALKEKLAAGTPLSESERQQLAALQQAMRDYQQQAEALADAMDARANQPSLYEAEEPFKEQLRELAAALRRQGELADDAQEGLVPYLKQEQQSAPGSGSGGGPQAPGVTPVQRERAIRLVDLFQKEEKPFDEASRERRQDTADDLMRLELAEELVYHAERIRDVIVRQRELEAQLAALRRIDGPPLTPEEAARLGALGDEELALRDELADAATNLREVAELAGPALPKMSGSSVALVEQIKSLRVDEDLERVSRRAAEGDAALAHASAILAADKLDSLLSEAGGMQGHAVNDLDRPLNLPKAGVGNSLAQSSAARRAAAKASGQSPGQGAGQASGEQGQGAGTLSGGVEGNTPARRAALMRQASLLGPHRPAMGNARSGSGRQAAGQGTGGAAGEAGGDADEAAEQLDPGDANAQRLAAPPLPGVPARYQDAAAAYFQRLAEDAARSGE